MTIAEKKSFRESFFAEAGENIRLVAQTMNYLPDIAMYIKAADGRIVALNKRNCEFCNKVQQYCASRSMQFQHKNVIPLRNARGTIIGTMCFHWLSDIAQETGFYDLSHFTKAFKSVRGMTPGHYRKNHLAKRSS